MDVLSGMRAFRAVVEAGSFVGAARAQKITTAWVSKRVAQLEEHLGAQLLVRTTRKVALTDVGRLYLERCARVLDELDEAERSVSALSSAPKGRLRITAPMSFGLTRLAPLLPTLSARYPELEVEVTFSDRYLDLLEDGLDAAIRIGADLEDSSLVVRRLGGGERVLCAAPAYLRAHGTPRHPHDLASHRCLRYALHARPNRWSFEGPDGQVSVDVGGPLQMNNSLALATAAVEGAGVLLAPDFVVEAHLAGGRLRRLLPRFVPSGYSVFVLAPPARFATPKVRAFAELVARSLADAPPARRPRAQQRHA